MAQFQFSDYSFWGLCVVFALYIIKEIISTCKQSRLAKFNTAIQLAYSKVDEFMSAALCYRKAINTISLEYFTNREGEKLDRELTEPLASLRNKTIMLEIIFKEKDRKIIRNVFEMSLSTNDAIHRIYTNKSEFKEISETYENLRANYNESFKTAITRIVELSYKRLFGVIRL